MAEELTAGGARVYRDSAGILTDVPPGAGSGGGLSKEGLEEALNDVLADNKGTQSLDLTTAGSAITIAITNGEGVLGCDISGLTGSGATVVCEMALGGVWRSANMLVNGTAGAFTNSLTADATFRANASARWETRLRVTTAGSGTATVVWSLSTNSSVIQLAAPLPPGANVIGAVTISGAVAVTGTVTANVTFPATQQVGGTVNIANFPSVQPVSGGVSVTNFPATQPVTGTFFQALQPVVLTPVATAANAIDPVRTTNAASLIGKASPGNFYGATVVSNPSGGSAYVLVLNRAAVPASGAAITPSDIIAMTGFSAGGISSIAPDMVPDRCSVGCVLVVSTSTTTYTPPTANLPLFIKIRVV